MVQVRRNTLRRSGSWVLWLAAMLAAGCVPVPAAGRGGAAVEQRASPEGPRTLSIVLRNEPFDLTDSASSRNRITVALFTAGLVDIDGGEVPYPVLAEAVPQLNTDSWRVFADGGMETVYRLKPNLVWHDGTPLLAEDFVFARRANAARFEWGLSVSGISPVEHRAIREILAPEAHTLVIRWRQPYPDAVAPAHRALPRHILEASLDQAQPELFGSHPYWTTEHVGLGPYRLARWEQGAYLEGVAFDRYPLGRPKIERVRVTWSGDPNVTLARMLAGDAHITMDGAIQFQQAAALRREWAPSGAGRVLVEPRQLRQLQAQHRPAYANPQAVLDPRVRKAAAHAIDRKALADALLEGEGLVAEATAPPTVSYYHLIERTAPTYPFDLRRTEQLMAEAGFTRGPDGVYASPIEGRYSPEIMGIAEGQEGQETTIVLDYFRKAGFDAHMRLAPAALLQQTDEMKATFPAWRTNYTGANRSLSAERALGSRAATAENRWSGTNKMGWSNPEHDRLFEAWTRALDRDQRIQLMVQIVQLTMEELPYIPQYFNFEAIAHTVALEGPQLGGIETTPYWNVHQWRWR